MGMIELDTKYRSDKRTFVYLFIRHGWWLIILAALLIYFSYEISFGQLEIGASQFLADHSNWYVNSWMLSQWTFFVAIGVLLIVYLRRSSIAHTRSASTNTRYICAAGFRARTRNNHSLPPDK